MDLAEFTQAIFLTAFAVTMNLFGVIVSAAKKRR
jgi:hypothetical protein